MDQNKKVEASTRECPSVSKMGLMLRAHLEELLLRKAEVEKRLGTLRIVLRGLQQMEQWATVNAIDSRKLKRSICTVGQRHGAPQLWTGCELWELRTSRR